MENSILSILIAGMLGLVFLVGFYRQKAVHMQAIAQEVLPAEDLMREHGILRRLLLIYEECIRRMRENRSIEKEKIHASALLIKQFVEDYHEKQEENYLFTRFEKAGKLVQLVRVLRAQHDAGRQLTETIVHLTAPTAGDVHQELLIGAVNAFIRMYRPHAAREDTELFPELRSIMTAQEYEQLGDLFEDNEHKLFGKDGFEQILGKVIKLETELGINSLDQFTPGK